MSAPQERPQNCGTGHCSCVERVMEPSPPDQTDSMGIPLSCGKPACSPNDHHPLCKLAQPEPSQGSWVSATDVKRLARELDVAMNGEAGAAENPSLCDVVSQAIVKLAQPEQEPVGVVCMDTSNAHMMYGTQYLGQQLDRKTTILFKDLEVGTQLYTTPPQRKPLLDEEIDRCIEAADTKWADAFVPVEWARHLAKAIEAAHGIKE